MFPTFNSLYRNNIVIISIQQTRALRPFKAINNRESLKELTKNLIKSVKGLFHVAIFLVFILLIFALIGTQLYHSSSYQRCRETPEPSSDGNWIISSEF